MLVFEESVEARMSCPSSSPRGPWARLTLCFSFRMHTTASPSWTAKRPCSQSTMDTEVTAPCSFQGIVLGASSQQSAHLEVLLLHRTLLWPSESVRPPEGGCWAGGVATGFAFPAGTPQQASWLLASPGLSLFSL